MVLSTDFQWRIDGVGEPLEQPADQSWRLTPWGWGGYR